MPSNFDTIAELLEDIVNLPVGTIRALANFDFDGLIKDRVEIAKKDEARVTGFFPAVLQRAVDLGVTVGLEIGVASVNGEPVLSESHTVTKSVELDQLVREAIKVVEAFYAQAIAPTIGDPFKDERQLVRIFAKRNSLDQRYQDLLGVSEATPTEYE